jgi:hypothetical protein
LSNHYYPSQLTRAQLPKSSLYPSYGHEMYRNRRFLSEISPLAKPLIRQTLAEADW